MLRALVVLGLLGVGQAWINSQTRARRQRLGTGRDARSLQNWEDEGGAVRSGPQLASSLPMTGTDGGATGTMGAYPSAGQAG